jgi:hypothetical protein
MGSSNDPTIVQAIFIIFFKKKKGKYLDLENLMLTVVFLFVSLISTFEAFGQFIQFI